MIPHPLAGWWRPLQVPHQDNLDYPTIVRSAMAEGDRGVGESGCKKMS